MRNVLALFLALVPATAWAQKAPAIRADSLTLDGAVTCATGKTCEIGSTSVTALGGTTARTLSAWIAGAPDTPQARGAYADAAIVNVTATIPAGSSTLTTSGALFSAGDVGKSFNLSKAGTQLTTGGLATLNVSTAGVACTGTIPTILVNNGASGGRGGSFRAAATATGATIANGGTGYTNGTQTLTIAPLTGYGTPAQVSVTVSGSVVTSVNSIAVAGSFSGYGINGLNALPTSGGGGTGATLNLTVNVPTGAAILNAPGIDYGTGASFSTANATCTTNPVFGGASRALTVLPLGGTITGYISPTQITLSTPALISLSGTSATLSYGHDDTAAFNACAATKNCFIPPGSYMVGNVATVSGGTLQGASGLAYAGDVAGAPTASQSVTSTATNLIAAPGATSVLNVEGRRSLRISGVFIDCNYQAVDGISSGATQPYYENIAVQRCYKGIGTTGGSSYTAIGRLVNIQASNNKYGIDGLVDSVILGGAASANAFGLYLGTGANANSFISFRIESNTINGAELFQSRKQNFVSGLIDQNYGCGISFNGAYDIALTSTFLNRNGVNDDGRKPSNAQLCADNGAHDITLTNVTSATGRNDSGNATLRPYALWSINGGLYNLTVSGGNLTGYYGTLYDGPVPTGWINFDASNGLMAPKLSVAPVSAPGAGQFRLFALPGTNAGSCKLSMQAGTSATATTVADNVGTGC